MDQNQAPLFEALVERQRKQETSFHVPGHKFGSGLTGDAKDYYAEIMRLDYTEIEGLDDLHHPEGIILEAQKLAADCFGADASFFLIGGSTVGNLAVLTTVCSRGDVILVQRNAHKSVIHGLMLAGAHAVFLQPETDSETGIAGGVSLEVIEAALKRYPDAKAVFLTNPNYYGMGYDLADYARLVHRYHMPLLIDEAHGAHFGLHERVPPSALSRYADAVIQSTHKMLTAMTMGAMLHVKGNRVNLNRLKQRLAMLQSSSPSYPLMASLDLARRLASTSGRERIGEALERLDTLIKRAAGFQAIRFVGPSAQTRGYDYIDPFKLTVYDQTNTFSGFQLQKELSAKGVIAEMADERHVVLACSLVSTDSDLRRLGDALQEIELQVVIRSSGLSVNTSLRGVDIGLGRNSPAKISEPVPMGMDSFEEEDTLELPLEEAAGRIAAESVIPYPPGIPLLFPGEVIRPEVVEQIRKLADAGARFQGALQDRSGCSILVKKAYME